MLTALGVLMLITPSYGQALSSPAVAPAQSTAPSPTPPSQAPARGATPSPASPSASRTPPRDVAVAGPPGGGDGRIRGRVLRADGTTPIRRAEVTLAGDQNVKRMVTTDGEGRFEFSDLPAGRFTIAASRGGYLTMQYGQRRPFEPGRPVTLSDAQALGGIDLALPRAGAINGRVLDRYGDPAVGAQILVERYQYTANGQRRLSRAPGTVVGPNDLGEFRVFGLMPGQYIVSATLRPRAIFPGTPTSDTPVVSYVQTYSPGTPNVADAQPVMLGVGEEASVEFSLALGRLVRISGTVLDSAGRPAAGADVSLLTVGANGAASGRGSGSVSADGRFAIPNVPPGEHFVQIRLAPRVDGSGALETANAPITVNGTNVDGVQITTAPPGVIVGAVEWEGTAARTGSSTPFRISATSAEGRPALLGMVSIGADASANGTVGADGRFRLGGVMGKVRVSADGVPPQWMIKSITANGVDLMTVGADATTLTRGAPIRVVLTDRVTEVKGSVRTPQGDRASEYVVVILPAEGVDPAIAARHTHALRPDQQGVFRVRGIPPGRYVAAAVDALEQGAEWDPAFQNTIRRDARAFTVAEGETQTLTLDLLP
jgi:hypothetical protein